MIANQIKDYLVTKGAGTYGTNLFISTIPDTPDNAVCLYDETGTVSDYQGDYGSDWVGLQVMVRGSYAWASAKVWEIHNLITGLHSIDQDDYHLVTSRTQTPPAQVDVDSKGRRVYSAHYMYLVAQKTNENRIPVTITTS